MKLFISMYTYTLDLLYMITLLSKYWRLYVSCYDSYAQ